MISDAVILMAGSGSRFGGALAKSLLRVRGQPIIAYIFANLLAVGIKTIHAIVGFEAERLIAGLKPLVPSSVELRFIENHEWRKQNGISLLAARGRVTAPFLLVMSDHLFDQQIVDLVIDRAVRDEINLAIDRKLGSIFDLADATKVRTRGDRIVQIGKELADYDAIDTGVFVCPDAIFGYLEHAKENENCSLSDGVRAMAKAEKARVIDIGAAWWQDIDTPEALAHAEQHLGANAGRSYERDAAKN